MQQSQSDHEARARALRAGFEDGAVVLIAPETRRIVNTKGVPMHRPRIGVRLRYRIEGEVTLRDGRIAGGDLLRGGYDRIFAQRVEPGSYPVLTVYAETHRDRVAAIGVIRFADETAERCKLALFENEDPSEVTDDMTGGLGTDSGTIALGEPQPEGLVESAEQFDELEQRVDIGFSGDARCQVLDQGGSGVCVWRSGFGSGMYTPYWGIGRDGRICFLAADFHVVANGLYARPVPWKAVGESLEFQPETRLQSWWRRLWSR